MVDETEVKKLAGTETSIQKLPPGSVKRIMKYYMKVKGKGFTEELVPAMCKYLEKQIEELTNGACDETEEKGKRRITLKNFKDAAERKGVLIE